MGGELCKNCRKGVLIRKGKRTKVRCTVCGYWKFRSPNASSRGALIGALPIETPEVHPNPKVEEEGKAMEEKKKVIRRKKPEEDIPIIEEEREKLHPKDPDYGAKKAMHDQMIQAQRREFSIQKILKDMRKRNKYAKLGPTVIIDGEVFDLETGDRVYKEGPAMEAEEVE